MILFLSQTSLLYSVHSEAHLVFFLLLRSVEDFGPFLKPDVLVDTRRDGLVQKN